MVRENTLIALIASTFLVERTNTVVMVFATFAFVALSLSEILAEQFGIGYCFAASRRTGALATSIAFCTSP